MALLSSVLCPIDLPGSPRGPLRYAAAIAEHFSTRLLLVTVNDPLTAETAALTLGSGWLSEEGARELRRFFGETFDREPPRVEIDVEVASGKPAPEILRTARERACGLIVMSSQGQTGLRKLFFGSTTERVLRETTLPVLVTPPTDPGPVSLERLKTFVRHVLAPVDLTAATDHQLQLACRIAESLDVRLLVTHVIEPARFPLLSKTDVASVERERRSRAAQALDNLVRGLPPRLKPEALIVHGDPAEQIVKVATDRIAGLIVMGLHSSALMGPRMGSVTYRVLCLASSLVLAVPPVSTVAHDNRDESLAANPRLS